MGITKEQEIAVMHFGSNAIVSASAGSGKTTMMMEKVSRMLTNEIELPEKVDISRIAIVTYTNAVAAELKSKVAKRIVEDIQKGKGNAEDLKQQLEDLPLANVSTIHSLCSRIIREYFTKADVDPTFMLMDEKESSIILNKAIQNVLSKHSISYSKEYEVLSNYLNPDFAKDLSDLYKYVKINVDVKNFIENKALISYSKEGMEKLSVVYFDVCAGRITEYINECEKLRDEVAKYDELEKFYSNLSKVITTYKSILIQGKDKALELINSLSFEIMKGKPSCEESENLKNETVILIKSIKDFNKEIKKTLDAGVLTKEDKLIADELLKVIQEVDSEYIRLKKEDNKIDFADLEHKMVLLLNDEDTRKEIQERFDYIFVDEYQDINVVQNEILNRMSNGTNLFAVGDAKQSIYGFRHSDPTIFINKVDKYFKDETQGKSILLNKNFRSRKEILEFVNRIFNVIMEKETTGVNYKDEAQLIFGQDKYEDLKVNPIKIATFVQKPAETAFDIGEDGVYSVKEHKNVDVEKIGVKEADYIYSEILKHVGKTIVHSENGKRPCKYSDIALLCRQRNATVSNIIERLNELGLPVDSTAIMKGSKNEAVDMLISFLEVINNGLQDINLVNSLLSPFGDFTLSDLYKISSTIKSSKTFFYKAFNSYKGDVEVESKIQKFKQLVEKYKYESQFKQVDKLIEGIISENLFYEYVLSLENGERMLFQVRTFINDLSKKAFNSSLSRFLTLYREHEDLSEAAEVSTSEKNCVQMATMHASKGLEYPIVFCIDSANGFNIKERKIKKSKDFGIQMTHIDFENKKTESTCNEKMLQKIIVEKTITEEMRLFYVALTRAREYLYVTASIKKSLDCEYGKLGDSVYDCRCALDFIKIAISKDEEFKQKYYVENPQVKVFEETKKAGIIFEEKDDTLSKLIEENMQDNYEHKTSTSSSIVRNVTELNKLSESYLEESSIACDYDFIPSDNKTSPEAGTAYHRVLECIDYNCFTIEDVKDEIDRMVLDGEISLTQKQLVDPEDILSCMQSEIMNIARHSMIEKEKAFYMYVKEKDVLENGSEDKILIRGAIDLFIRKNDQNKQNILVDFKYSKSSCEAIKERYRKQLDLYQMALEKCLGEKVDRKVIYVLGANQTIEY